MGTTSTSYSVLCERYGITQSTHAHHYGHQEEKRLNCSVVYKKKQINNLKNRAILYCIEQLEITITGDTTLLPHASSRSGSPRQPRSDNPNKFSYPNSQDWNEEASQPLVEDFLYICDDAYSRYELLATERDMLHVLHYTLDSPIPYRFLRRFARAAEVTMEIHTLARYICELTLQEYDFIEHKPSLLAASALFLALKMKKAGNWTSTLEYYSEYSERDLVHCVKQLNALVGQKPRENVSTVRNKYAHTVFFESSKVPSLNLQEDDTFL